MWENFKESYEEEEDKIDIAFRCNSCSKEVIRDSEEHDHSKCGIDDNLWYCSECDVPEEEQEDYQEEEEKEEDKNK